MAATRVQHVEGAQIAPATNLVLNWASTPTAGNLLVAWMNGDSIFNLPSGYTTIYAVVNNNDWKIGYKVAAGNETSATFGFTNAGSAGGLVAGIIEYSGLVTSTVPEGGLNGIATTHAYNYGYAASGAQISPSVQITYTGTDLILGIAGLGAVVAVPSAPVWTTGTPLNGNNFASPGTGGITSHDVYAFVADNTASASAPTIDCTWTGNTAATRSLMLVAFSIGTGNPTPAATTGRSEHHQLDCRPRDRTRHLDRRRLQRGRQPDEHPEPHDRHRHRRRADARPVRLGAGRLDDYSQNRLRAQRHDPVLVEDR
jgi:hypothetical protein